MNTYSKSSERKLATCDKRLQLIFRKVLQIMDHTILEGRRGKEDQEKYFKTGASKLHWPHGKHNVLIETDLSKALDATPYPVDFTDIPRQCYFSGVVMGVAASLEIPLRCGADFDRDNYIAEKGTFIDLPHHELIGE